MNKIFVFAAAVGIVTLFPPSASAQIRYPPLYPPLYPYGSAYGRYDSDVRITVTPKEASVFVDGYFAGQVNDFDGAFQRLRVEPGQHEIAVYLQGYRGIRERLYLSPGSTRKISGTLEPLAPGEPDPGPPAPAEPPQAANGGRGAPGAGPLRDPGPLPRRGPPPPDRRAPPPLGPGADARGAIGTLSVRVQPGDAEVLIDGEHWAFGSSSERLLVQLSEGRHVVDVVKSGYRRFSTEVQLHAGETLPLNVSLTPER